MKKLILLIAALAMVASFAMTAAAAEWNFYGSARIGTFSENDEDIPGVKDDRDTAWYLGTTSRIGANVKVSDTLIGVFEYGSGPNLRRLFGEWNFGAGKLLVGQEYTPISAQTWISNQAWNDDRGMLDTGKPYIGRIPQLQLTFGGLKVAFVQPNTSTPAGLTGDTDITLPKFELAYTLKMDNFKVVPFAGYQSYEVSNCDVDSYVVGVAANATFGAAYVNADVYMARNGKAYGLAGVGASSLGYDAAKNEVIDNDTLGYLLVVGFKVSDMITLEAGYGVLEHELDVAGSKSDDSQTYYLQAAITLAPGVFVIPEIGCRDLKENAAGADEGKLTYFGAKWQMNF